MIFFLSWNWQTAAEDGVRLWDLRKLRNFKSFLSADANSGTQLSYLFLLILLIENFLCIISSLWLNLLFFCVQWSLILADLISVLLHQISSEYTFENSDQNIQSSAKENIQRDQASLINLHVGLTQFMCFGCRVYQTASVKAEWNLIKTLPDLSGTGKVPYLTPSMIT